MAEWTSKGFEESNPSNSFSSSAFPMPHLPTPIPPKKDSLAMLPTLNYNMCAKLKLENKFFLWFEWKSTIFRKT